MKKYLGIILAAICILLCPMISYASAGTVTELNAEVTDTGVSITGVASDMLAVAIQLRDKDDNILTMESTNVLGDGSFALEINDIKLAGGTEYFVYAADYDGGEWKTVSFKTKSTEPKFLCEALTMNIGTDVDLEDVYDKGGQDVTFKTSDKKIFTIEGDKLVPKKTGSAKLSAICNGKTTSIGVKVYNPTLSAPNVVYLNGKTVTLSVKSGAPVTVWSCSDTEILSITEKGVVKGLKTGKVTVTAENNGKTLIKDIYVCDTPKFGAKSITLNANTVEGEDNTVDFAKAVLAGTDTLVFDDCGISENGAGELVFKSSNAKVAKIEGTKLIPIKAGSATITAKVDGKSYKLSVKVYDPKLTAPNVVYLGKKPVTLKMKSGAKATEWSVNNEGVLTISDKGVVTPVANGEAVVTAVNNGRTIAKKIYVCNTPKFNAKSITLNANTVDGEDNTVDFATAVLAGTETLLFDDYGIVDHEAGELVFKSSNAKVVKIEGTKLIPLKAGKATITAKIDGKSYKLSVKVYDPKLAAPDVVYLGAKAVTLKIKSGVKATDWSVTDENILSITEKGVIKGVANGEVTVTAVNNGRTITKKIYVCEKPCFSAKTAEVKLGETLDIAGMFDDKGIVENGYGTATYSSSSKKIATIDESGILTPVKAGKVTVTVKVAGKSYKITVKVVK